MDDRRFDQLTKALSDATGSRRETLGLAVGSAAAAVLGFLGVEEAAVAQRGDNNNNNNKNRRRRNRNRNKDREKNQKVCHCPDATGNNCKTQTLSEKKVKKHLREHPNDYAGKCTKTGCQDLDTECNVNRPGECCAQNCCFDATSSTSGICPTQGGNCCGLTTTGGYCTTSFPQCCGEEACCRTGEVCCSNVRQITGYCCPPGYRCDFNQFNGCLAPQAAVVAASLETSEESVIGSFEPRRRAGNLRR
jgi:hypothetical protein